MDRASACVSTARCGGSGRRMLPRAARRRGLCPAATDRQVQSVRVLNAVMVGLVGVPTWSLWQRPRLTWVALQISQLGLKPQRPSWLSQACRGAARRPPPPFDQVVDDVDVARQATGLHGRLQVPRTDGERTRPDRLLGPVVEVGLPGLLDEACGLRQQEVAQRRAPAVEVGLDSSRGAQRTGRPGGVWSLGRSRLTGRRVIPGSGGGHRKDHGMRRAFRRSASASVDR